MSIKIKNLFEKEISRDIKEVIKVSQCHEENIKEELEEYIVTEELNSHLDEFFKAYSKGILNNTDEIGVWISGFFGSGKSHFLKILSNLLCNKAVDNKGAIEYFYNKELCDSTIDNMNLIKSISTETILFNIDSKSNFDSKFNKDAIVSVLNKVFNEMQGFCSSVPWIADIERQMTLDGAYEEFKKVFNQLSKKSWKEAREDFYYEEDAIVEALSIATKMSKEAAKNWYRRCEESYSLSIDKFTSRVKEYCDSKGENHHIVFLIDEIGQYIGKDTGLMLNLQTIVEDLGAKCKGRCWIIVTAQEDLNEFTRAEGIDFSKIQGRFNTRLSLSSTNVDEVIKKRILRKSINGISELKSLYEEKNSVITNLLTFTMDSMGVKLYSDSDEFVENYPFIPYQFSLFQVALEGLREQGLVGRSLSNGERSLLGAYHQIAIQHMDEELGSLVPFSDFYSTIESFLDSSVRLVISYGENNERLNNFDIEVLKLLFLIKYTKKIKSNIENLATLLVDKVTASKRAIKKNLQESLNRLIVENFIEKNGDEYIFLTANEQEINKRIKNIQIDSGEIIQRVKEIIFNDIYEDTKFTYSNRYTFNFNKFIDDEKKEPKYSPIGVRIITANYDLAEESRGSELKHLSDIENNVIIDISKNDSYLEEIENVLKIDSYLRVEKDETIITATESIDAKKIKEREERLNRAKFLIEEALKESEVYISGTLLNIKYKNPVGRINEGLRVLVDSVYNKLNYINKFLESNKNLQQLIDSYNQHKEVNTEVNKLAMEEINNYIKISFERNLQITMKHLINRFSDLPYGWNKVDIKGIIIKLFKNQCIKIIYDDEIVYFNNNDIMSFIIKREYEDKLILKYREKIKREYIETSRELIKDVFDTSAISSNEYEIMEQFKKLSENELKMINHMILNYNFNNIYPGEKIVRLGKRLFEEGIKLEDTIEFFKYIYDVEEEFLDYIDEIDNIKSFFYKKENNRINLNKQGEQVISFNNAVEVVRYYEENIDFIDDVHIRNIIEEIKKIISMAEPYSKIPQLPMLIESYNNIIVTILKKEREPVLEFIDKCSQDLIKVLCEYGFTDKFEYEILTEFKKLMDKTENSSDFSLILSMIGLSEKQRIKWINRIAKEAGIENKIKALSMREIIKKQNGIKDEDDINEIVEDFKRKLVEELRKGAIINLV